MITEWSILYLATSFKTSQKLEKKGLADIQDICCFKELEFLSELS